MKDSFGARSTLAVGGDELEIFRLDAVTEGHAAKLPYSLKILLDWSCTIKRTVPESALSASDRSSSS